MFKLFNYIKVPTAFDRENIRLYRHAKLLNFFLIFFSVVFLYSSVFNFFTTDFYLVIAVEAVLVIVCVGTYYWFRTRADLVIPSWVVSSVCGFTILFLIFYAKGAMDTYSLLLIYPLVAYSLHGIKTGTILHVGFSSLTVITLIYGLSNWQFLEPTATIFNVSATLIIGGSIIYYFESSKTEALDKLYLVSMIDPLTGLWNRKMFNEIISIEHSKSKRYKIPLSLIISDLDYFKNINDTYGHHIGDLVLKEYAQIISQRMRESDILFRWGGEEFVIILPNTFLADAEKVASSLVDSVRNHEFKEIGKITISVGVGEFNSDSSFGDNFKQIDDALYQAKSSGRDRYVAI